MNTSTKAVGAQSLPAVTTVDGDQDLTSATTLKVVSLVGFDPSGQFTIAGISGTCSYTGTSGGNVHRDHGLQREAGERHRGHPRRRTSSLTVLTTTGFDLSNGMFTGTGITGTCTYTGTSGGNTFTGITGCSGSLKDNASITRVAEGPGIYKWDDSTKQWLFQSVGIPTGTGFPTSPATGDYFQLTKAPSTTVKARARISRPRRR